MKLQWSWIATEILTHSPPFMLCFQTCATFIFFPYNGTKFQYMAKITITQQPCAQFMKGITQVCFHIILCFWCYTNLQLKSQTYCFLSCWMDILRYWRWCHQARRWWRHKHICNWISSFNRFAKFRFLHMAVSLQGNWVIKKWPNKYGLLLFLLAFFLVNDH